MNKDKKMFRPGVVIVTFTKDWKREWAERYFAESGLTINRWFWTSKTAEISVPEGHEEHWLKEILSYSCVQGASLDMHL